MTYGIIASIMTTQWGPGAVGSGIGEIIGYLNGVNYKDFVSIPTLITKIIGVSFAISGMLCVGNEGPLAHIGANLGMAVIYFPCIDFDFLKNDEAKRQLAAAGASTGVSVAFGAPIGGALFCYELSKHNTFWKFEMIWKVFFACCIGTFSLAGFHSLIEKPYEIFNWSGSALKFGSLQATKTTKFKHIIPASIILGLLGGFAGAFFIHVNTKINKLRKIYITKSWQKVAETAFFSFVTATLFYWMTWSFHKCYKESIRDERHPNYEVEYYRFWCKEGEYGTLATLFFSSENEVIRNIMSANVKTSLE